MLATKVKRFAPLLAIIAVVLCLPAVAGAKRNLADYTLRLHIYGTNWSHNGWGYHGFGRANLFDEQGTPHGVEYTYDCADHLMASSGEEAYPAKWKKQGQEIEVIFGEIGENPDKFHACDFKIAEKSFVYYRHNGLLDTESPQEFLGRHPRQTPSSGTAGADDVPRSANPHPY
ncbi:MAG TPA: hypothetical protein VG714_08830 [Acidobacteriaceae bacterium]|nr:hypothetical protein [Acidobacteriaceae bacterium]